MRLALVNLTGGGFSGGYKKYLRNILPRLAAHKSVKELLCVSPEGNDVAGWVGHTGTAEYATCRPFTLKHLFCGPDRQLSAHLRRFAPDIIFLPVDRYISFGTVPVVNMVHNMEPFVPHTKGDTLSAKLKKLVQKHVTVHSVRRAHHTIAVSAYVKDYLTGIPGIDKTKVSHIYHGRSISSGAQQVRPSAIPMAWDSDFVFTCGSIRPARGLEDLLQAMSEARDQAATLHLVIAGDTSPGMRQYRHRLEQLLQTRGLADRVCWAGTLTDEEMGWCYTRCRLFVMTSRIEACPNTAIEALSHGALVVAADNPPLPEFFSGLAAYYAPGDAASLSLTIGSRMTLDDNARTRLSEQSRARSAMFSWEVTTEKTLAVLTHVLSESRRARNRRS